MGNRVPVNRDELLEYTIDGIPDIALHDQALIQRFATMDSLLKAFNEVSLKIAARLFPEERTNWRIGEERETRFGGGGASSYDEKKSKSKQKSISSNKRCYNCREREHVSVNCPKKELGAKCFKCGKYGHIASNCPKKNVERKDRQFQQFRL